MSASRKKRVLAIPSDLVAAGQYRIIRPYTKLAGQDFQDIEFRVHRYQGGTWGSAYEAMDWADAVVFHRVFTAENFALIAYAKAEKKLVCMDVDDDIRRVSAASPVYDYWKAGSDMRVAFQKSANMTDWLHCSTPEIAQAYLDLVPIDRTQVFLNAIDVTLPVYQDPPRRRFLTERGLIPEDAVVLYWGGGMTHTDSMDVIYDVIGEICTENPRIHLCIAGMRDFMDKFQVPTAQKIFLEWIDSEQYAPYPSYGDIAIVPTALIPFNDAKSEIKCLEAGMWCIPAICSPSAPYRRFHQLSGGGNVLAHKNKRNRWKAAILGLAVDAQERRFLGRLSYEAVLQYYTLDQINASRVAFFRRVL